MKKEYNSIQGAIGELCAKKYLESKKYKILEQNYKNKLGEIDIIAMDKKTLVFVEVKERSTLAYGRPGEAVNICKQQKIRSVASLYLVKNNLHDSPCRFDVIEVLGGEINHIENAF